MHLRNHDGSMNKRKRIEDLAEVAPAREDAGGGLPLKPRCMPEGPPNQRCVASNVGTPHLQLASHEADRPWRIGRTEQHERGFDITPKVVGHEECGIRGVQEQVHPPRCAREIVERKLRRRHRPVANDDEPTHLARSAANR